MSLLTPMVVMFAARFRFAFIGLGWSTRFSILSGGSDGMHCMRTVHCWNIADTQVRCVYIRWVFCGVLSAVLRVCAGRGG